MLSFTTAVEEQKDTFLSFSTAIKEIKSSKRRKLNDDSDSDCA